MNEKEMRAVIADRMILVALIREKPTTSDNALEYLLVEARKSAAYVAHVEGGEVKLDLRETVESAMRSEVGQMIYDATATTESSSKEDELARINALPPQARINEARRLGLA